MCSEWVSESESLCGKEISLYSLVLHLLSLLLPLVLFLFLSHARLGVTEAEVSMHNPNIPNDPNNALVEWLS